MHTPMNGQELTRRHFFRRGALGLGGAALASLMGPRWARASTNPAAARTRIGGLPELPHFAPTAKRAIYLFMAEGPSQMDTFDYKPGLAKLHDQDLPKSVIGKTRLTTMTSGQGRLPVAASKYKFEQVGKAGLWVSELMPFHKQIVDDICLLKSVWTEAINHDPAITYICTGNQIPGRASLGAWLSYGLGSENQDLPAFVVMTPSWTGRRDAQALYNRLWGSGFLPSKHQGVALRAKGDPVLFLSDPPGVDRAARRETLDALSALNKRTHENYADPETLSRIAQYEMAFRMQASVPELTDLSGEPPHILDLYGPDVHKPGTFARSALLARRMMERGVRFVQIFHRGWDQHFNLAGDLPKQCKDVDQACAALIKDLKQRGLLDETLVVWGGEFGRTIYSQGNLQSNNYGRDHHPNCFPMWMAGGGVKSGQVYGETDDFSYNITQNPVHIHQINATILHCLGIDDKRFTYRHEGLDIALTGVEPAPVVKDILA